MATRGRYICTREDCDEPADFLPMILVPGPRDRAVSAILALPVCACCFESLRAGDLIAKGDPAGEALRAGLAMQANGRFLLDFDRADVASVDIDCPAAAHALDRVRH